MKKYILALSLVLLAASCAKRPASSTTQNQATSTPPAQTASTTPSMPLPVEYNNTQYQFTFSLPADWQGFSTYASAWTGTSVNGSSSPADTGTGPIIYIRNPKWTQANPYEDIPVMVFTPSQWKEVSAGNMAVSAAPFPPSELGSNANYVFALPARYDYNYATGYQEVEQIMQNYPLSGY